MDKILVKIAKSYKYLGLSDEEKALIIAKIKDRVTKNNITASKKITDIANYEFLLAAKEKLRKGDFNFVINYLRNKKAEGPTIFILLNQLFKQLKLDISFELGMYLIEQYQPLANYFSKIVESMNSNKTYSNFNDDIAELLFELYCDSKSINLSKLEEEITGSNDEFLDDSVRMWLNEVGKYKLINDKEEEIMLFKKFKNEGSKSAKNELICRNLRLVVSIAKRFYVRNYNRIDFLDLIEEGNLGLIKAIEDFDASRGTRLSTYATWWIRHYVSKYVANTLGLIRIPAHMSEKIRKIKKAVEDYEAQYGTIPNNYVLSQLTGFSENVVEECRLAALYDATRVSVDEPVSDDRDSTVGDFIKDFDVDVEQQVTELIQKEEIAQVLKNLTRMERSVLELRFGLTDGRKRTLEEIGKEYFLTRERIRQIEGKALRKLRHPSKRRLLTDEINEEPPIKISERKKKTIGYLLKNCSEETQSYILQRLTTTERDIVYKKFGRSFDYNSKLNGEEATLFENIIIPKIKILYLRAEYHSDTYRGMFKSHEERCSIENYYLLTEEEQELLKFAYGEDLESRINSDVTYKEEQTIVKRIVPKLLSFKTSDNPRRYMSYKKLLENDRPFMPETYIKLFNCLFLNNNISPLLDNLRYERFTTEGIEYILSLVLTDNEIEYLKANLHNISLEKLRISLSAVEDNMPEKFQEIMTKLRNSPHIIKLSNYLAVQSRNVQKNIEEFNFYTFFNASEIKLLPIIMYRISFEDMCNIYRIFKNELSKSVKRSEINYLDYSDLILTITNIKKLIKSNIVEEPYSKILGELFEVYRYCDYLYDKPEFVELLKVLTKYERKALLDCLSRFGGLDISLQHVCKTMNLTIDDTVIIIKTALEKILHYLREKQNNANLNPDVQMVLELTKKLDS